MRGAKMKRISKESQEKIENEEKILTENDAIIKGVVDTISKHIDQEQTREYLDFIKEIAKYRKKIAKKKSKLKIKNKLSQAYDEKNSEVLEELKKFTHEMSSERTIVALLRNRWTIDTIVYYLESGNKCGIYYDMFERVNLLRNRILNEYDVDFLSKYPITTEKANQIQQLIQKHYNTINVQLMEKILNYYIGELEFWSEQLMKVIEEEESEYMELE